MRGRADKHTILFHHPQCGNRSREGYRMTQPAARPASRRPRASSRSPGVTEFQAP